MDGQKLYEKQENNKNTNFIFHSCKKRAKHPLLAVLTHNFS